MHRVGGGGEEAQAKSERASVITAQYATGGPGGIGGGMCTPLKAAADREIGVLWIPVSRTYKLQQQPAVKSSPRSPHPPPVRARTFRMINTLPGPSRNT